MLNAHLLSSLLAATLCFPVLATGQINVEIAPDPVVVVAGNQTTFDVVLSPSEGETFDAFTLAFAVGDGGTATGSPEDGDNLPISSWEVGSLFDGTDFTATVSAGGVGQSAILINFNRAAGNSSNLLADGVLVQITVDSSLANPTDSFVLNTNILGATAAFDDGAALEVSTVSGTLEIQADPDLVILGDVDQNGTVDFLDISPFITLLSTGGFLEEADINRDGTVDFLDISPFILILSGS